ncbi:CRISPR-associated endonuclease/helicase Cas3 [Halopseudomonas formosensis]|jgi:CRISPR-associated endonuclease/helicase Cas3|uniref:CRISPR-associated endonuclease/helicase Cas3 n=1 Tax=Halopseudomonas formosensis TaxID=1002526 RepID=A0A1I6BQ32_9GAMM|nr:CRISPR-associated helicase/endonuclease Cas3 [Halopseudomonas formosensis]SFQ83035.1 CRISPR-associated endonuclease/helicase Cas3 [Halopseudomonas formosensis]
MKFSEMSPSARILWAKSGEPTGHGLLAHLLDVAAVAETLLERETPATREWAAQQFGIPAAQVPRWIGALVGLHDFGKGIPGFQAKWEVGQRLGMEAGLAFPEHACTHNRHDLATANLLRAPLQQLMSGSLSWVAQAVQAVSAHHGFHFSSTEVNAGKPLGEPPEWRRARQEILTTYWQLLMQEPAYQTSPASSAMSLPAINWLAGLTSAADWIASNPEWFTLGERHDDLRHYHDDARQRATQALDQIGWHKAAPLLHEQLAPSDLLERITGRTGLSMRPLQVTGDALLETADGPALLLVEAPMGEGKTELALLAHLRLQATNQHRGLYVALPTQATGNAMFKRVLTFLDSFREGRLDIQLVHGGAVMNEEVQRLRGINDSEQDSLAASTWFAQRRRPLLSHYGVGTVDQALLSVINVKHHFVRLWGLSNRVVVLDEVHAYDTYTSGLIVTLLRWLKALGSSVVLMSATLPTARRNALLAAWGVQQSTIPEMAYPRVMLADRAGIRGTHFPARALSPIHLLALGESLDELAGRAIELVAEGGCGAIIVNTVERAQNLYLDLQNRLNSGGESIPILLMHARFPANERAEQEQKVLQLFGPSGERPHKAILIATQVAEQSLDMDFDFMLSDLAPVDLLLQRAGRLHRHDRPRPKQHTDAKLWVAGLQQERLPDLKETAWGYVYDAYILGRTWALLGKELNNEQGLQLPGDIDRLVQSVYDDGELPSDLESAARDCIETGFYGEYLAQINNHRQRAQNIVINENSELQDAYQGKPRGNDEGDDGVGLQNVTRLGSESITLIPVEVGDDGWRIYPGETPFPPGEPDSETARRLYARQIRVSRTAIVKYFTADAGKGSSFEPALLQNTYALPLQDGCCRIGKLLIRLDGSLGLVYETQDQA